MIPEDPVVAARQQHLLHVAISEDAREADDEAAEQASGCAVAVIVGVLALAAAGAVVGFLLIVGAMR